MVNGLDQLVELRKNLNEASADYQSFKRRQTERQVRRTVILAISIIIFLLFLGLALGLLVKKYQDDVAKRQNSQRQLTADILKIVDSQNSASPSAMTFTPPVNFKQSINVNGSLAITGTAQFQGDVFIKDSKLDLGNGTLNATNVLYGITPGVGIAVGGGQNPSISLNVVAGPGITVNGDTFSNSGVLSLQGQTGALSLVAGDNITIDGLKITAKAGASSNGFGTISVSGQSDISAGANDRLTIIAGSGITLSTNSSDKKLTIAAGSIAAAGGWTRFASSGGWNTVKLTDTADYVTIGGADSEVGKLDVIAPNDLGVYIQSGGPGLEIKTPNTPIFFNESDNGTLGVWRLVNDNGIRFDHSDSGGAFASYSIPLNLHNDGSVGIADNAITISGGIVALNSQDLSLTGGNRSIFSNTGGLLVGATGNLQFNANGNSFIWPTTPGSSGYSLTTDGSGNLSWTNVAGGAGTNYWNLTAGALSPQAISNDLLLGGSSTASALVKFGGTSGSNSFITSGNLGIGTTTTGNKFVVAGEGGAARIQLSDFNSVSQTAGAELSLTRARGTMASPSNLLNGDSIGGLYAAGYENTKYSINLGAIRFIAAGDFADNVAGTHIVFETTNDGTNRFERMRIADNGNVGIGTVLPVGLLNVNGTASGNSLAILNQTSTGAIFTASQGGTTKFIIANDGNVGIGTSNPNLFKVQVAGDIGPQTDITYDLGSSSNRWRNLYAQNVYGALTGVQGYWQRANGAVAPTNITDDVLIGSTATSSALTKFSGTVGGNSFINTGNLGIGTTTPNSTLDILGTSVNFSSTATSSAYGMRYDVTQTSLPTAAGDYASVKLTIGGTTYVYIMGGYDNSVPSDKVYRGSIDANGNLGGWTTSGQGQLPVGVYLTRAATVNIGGTNYVYVVGGYTNSGYSSVVYKATIDGSGNIGAWSSVGLSALSEGISDANLYSYSIGGNTYLYLIGGYGETTGDYLSTVYRAQIDGSGNVGAWSTSGQASLPAKKGDAALTSINIGGTQYLYIIGGYTSSATNTVYKGVIDGSGNISSWTASGQSTLPIAMSYESAVIVTNTSSYIFVLGGYDSTAKSSIYKASIDSSGNIGTFTPNVQGGLPVVLSDFTPYMENVNGIDYIYVTGGWNHLSNYQAASYRFKLLDSYPSAFYINSSGNVGIGTNTPTSKLSITGIEAASGITLGADQTNPIQIYYSDNPAARTLQIGADRIYTSAGYLSFISGANVYGALTYQNSGIYAGGNSLQFNSSDNAGSSYIYNPYASAHGFAVKIGSTEKFRIDSNGNVGIGTTNPSLATLQVSGTASILNALRVGDTNAPSITNLIAAEQTVTPTSGTSNGVRGVLTFSPASASTAVVTGVQGIVNPNSGVGGVNITGNGSAVGVYGGGSYSGTGGTLASAYGVRGTFDVSGSGTITDAYAGEFGVSVNGASGNITNGYGLKVTRSTVTGTINNLYGLYIDPINQGSSLNYSIYSAGGPSYFAGNIGIGTTNPNLFKLQVDGSIGPQADLTYDLGSPSNRWRNIYGNIIAASSGTNGYWQRSLGALSPATLTDDLLLGATGTSSALVKFTGTANANSFINTGGFVGIGTSVPDASLNVSSSSATELPYIHFGQGNAGGFLSSDNDSQFVLSGGTGRDPYGNWIARATGVTQIGANSDSIGFYTNKGLTVGSSYSPLIRMSVSSANTYWYDSNAHVRINFTSYGNIGVGDFTDPGWNKMRVDNIATNSAFTGDGASSIYATNSIDPGANKDNAYASIYSFSNTPNTVATNFTDTIYAIRGINTFNGSGSIVSLDGTTGELTVGNTANVTNASAIVASSNITTSGTVANYSGLRSLSISGTGNITSAAGVRVDNLGRSGIGTAYGVYIEGQSGASTNYGLYYNNTNSPFVIASNGNIGIGTTTPRSRLQVSGNSATNALVNLNQTGPGDVFSASVSGSTKFIVANSGNVGIGTISPTNGVLEVDHTFTDTSGIVNGYYSSMIASPASNSSATYLGAEVLMDTAANAVTYNTIQGMDVESRFFGTNTLGTDVAFIGSAQNNGVGTVNNAVGVVGRIANWSSGVINNAIGLEAVVNSNVGQIDNRYGVYIANGNGQVLDSGTITTNYGLYLENQIKGATNYSIYSAGGKSLFTGSASGNALFQINQTGSNSNDAIFTASQGGTTKFIIDNAGNVGVGTTNPNLFKLQIAGDVGPQTDITYDLGSATNRWRNIYAQNIYAGLTGTSGYWQRGFGALSPSNITDDLLLGATSTASATVKLSSDPSALSFVNAGSFGIGTTSATNKFISKQHNFTDPTVDQEADILTLYTNQTTNSSASIYGTVVKNFTASTNAFNLGGLYGVQGYAYHAGSGVLTGAFGGKFGYRVQGAGNITDAVGLQIASGLQSGTTGNITRDYGIFIRTPFVSGSGTIGTSYGLYLENMNAASTNYAIYSLGGQSYFAGNIGIGTTAPLEALDVRGNASFSGNLALKVPSGANPTTGLNIYNGGTFNIQQSAGGDTGLASRVYLDNTGNIGIGTINPSAKVDIQGNLSVGLGTLANQQRITSDGFGQSMRLSSPNAIFLQAINNTLTTGVKFQIGGGTTGESDAKAFLDNNGNLGIGTNTPLGLLQVSGNVGTNGLVNINQIGTGNIFSASSGGVTKFVVDNGGNVGVGTSSIDSGMFLDVAGPIQSKGAVPKLRLKDTDGGGITWDINTSISDSQTLLFTNASAARDILALGSGGNVGIGTTAPLGRLDVEGAATGKSLAIFNQTGDQAVLAASVSGSTKFIINNAGNVGIGTITPNGLLQVSGASTGKALVELNQTGNQAIFTASKSGVTKFTIDANGNTAIGTSSAMALFQVGIQVPTSTTGTTSVNGAWDVAVQGNVAFVSAYFDAALYAIDISDPKNPTVISSVGGLTTIRYVFVQGKYAYVTAGSSTNYFYVFDISNPANMRQLSITPIGTTLFDYPRIDVQGKYAYITNGSNNALKILDISNPYSPIQVSTISQSLNQPEGVAVQGKYVYVGNNGNGSLSIFDVSNPSTPALVGTATTGLSGNGVQGVSVEGRYAYITSSGIVIYDISNPYAPTYVSTLADPSPDQKVFIQGRYMYYSHNGVQAITIADISSPTTPFIVGTITSNLNEPRGVYAQGRYLYAASFSGSTFNVYDLGGSYIQQLEAGGIQTDTLEVRGSLHAESGAFRSGLSANNLFVSSDSAILGSANISGNLGVGTSAALFRLSVSDTQNSTASAYIENLANIGTNNPTGLIIKLGNDSTNPDAGDRYINFLKGNGAIIGKIQGNAGSGSLNYATGGTDFAEYFKKAFPGEVFYPGDLVCYSSNIEGVTRCNNLDTHIIGVISEISGFTGGSDHDEDPDYVRVGLVGQVPVTIALDSEPIHAGDYLTYSQTSGQARKATEASEVVGKALESWDSNSSKAQIRTYINVSFGDPQSIMTKLHIDNNGSLTGPNLSVPSITIAGIGDVTTAFNQQSAKMDAQAQTIAELQSDISSLKGPAATDISILTSTVATLSSQLTGFATRVDTVEAEQASQAAQIADLSSRVAFLEQAILSSGSAVLGAATTSNISSQSGTLNIDQDAVFYGNVNMLGKAILQDLGVTGKITNGLLTINGLDESWATPAATINTLSGPLMLQANSLNDVDVMNGKVIFDTVGNLNINVGDINVEKGNINVKNGDVNIKKGNIKIEQGQVIGNQTFRGKVVLPAGQTSVHIDETWSTEPESLTLTPNYATQVWYEDMSTTGFTIRVATPSPTDQYVNWLAAW